MARYIFVESLPKDKSAFDLDSLRDETTGKKKGLSKLADCKTRVAALYSRKVGGLKNGLSYKPWTEDGKQKTDKQGNGLTLQDKMEAKWNKPKGFFSNKAAFRAEDINNQGGPTYFQRTSWALNDGTTVFDLDTMDGEMFYHVAMADKRVANSRKELAQRKWPFAEFVITHAEEDNALKYEKKKRKGQAMANLNDSKLLTPSWRSAFIVILGLGTSQINLNEDQSYNVLYDYIDSSGYSEGSNLSKFEALVQKLKTADGKGELNARVLLAEALDFRVIHERLDSYTWHSEKGPVEIGATTDEAIGFLLNPKKEAIVDEVRTQIKQKKKALE